MNYKTYKAKPCIVYSCNSSEYLQGDGQNYVG